jgi:alkylation response protein AidB-like acyl-CoA dehydrogenase
VTRDADAAPGLAELADASELLGELRRAADEVLTRAWSPAHARAALDEDRAAWDPDLWATVVELGWAEVLADGSGAGEQEICVLAEALGAAGAPVPLVAAATAASMLGPSPDGLTLLVDGPPAELRSGHDEPALHGTWPAVPFGAVADRYVVELLDDEGQRSVALVRSDQVEREELHPLDRSPDAAVHLRDLPLRSVTVVGDVDAGPAFARARRAVTLGRVAELVGVASTANARAVTYAKQRVAYGHPIGAFQAIKHRLVDQRASIEIARALVRRAAGAAQRGSRDADPLTALAAFWAGHRLRAVTEGSIQVFGGIGYTWDHDAHVHLRRAACLTAALGDRRRHRDDVVEWLAGRAGGSFALEQILS